MWRKQDITNELKSQALTKIERTKRRKDGQLIPADSYILTINSPNISPQIKVGFLISDTKVYIPNRCLKLSKIWSQQTILQKWKKCANCGQAPHEDHECENETQCASCNGDHPSYTKSCPKWKIAKEILKINKVKYLENIPFLEARQQVKGPIIDPSKNSYTTLSKSHQGTINMKPPNSFETELELLTHTTDFLLKLSKLKSRVSIINCQSVLPLN